jgi:hypothetical protein
VTTAPSLNSTGHFRQPLDVVDALRLGKTEDLEVELFVPGIDDYSGVYGCFDDIDRIFGSSQTDRDILLDAHHLTQTTPQMVLQFVTMDGHHIHANSDEIESLLPSLTIKHPRDYV